MPRIIRVGAHAGGPIADGTPKTLPLVYFDLVRLEAGQTHKLRVPGFESVIVPLSGSVDLVAGTHHFEAVGRRADVWSGQADSVYLPTGMELLMTAKDDASEIAVAGGRWEEAFEPFRIPPEDVDMVDVGSRETSSRRRIFHILGQSPKGRVGNLLVSELHADPGCWSGYPPHKHDTDRPPAETLHEELYHYRFAPRSGFGGQFWYGDDGVSHGSMTRHGDTFLLDRGYHPTVTSPGHRGYIFTVLVGKERRPLLQHFDEEFDYLMSEIPGLQAMRDKFSGSEEDGK